METPEFYFRVTTDSQRIYAFGYKTVAGREFELEVTGIGDNEFEASGETEESAPAGRWNTVIDGTCL